MVCLCSVSKDVDMMLGLGESLHKLCLFRDACSEVVIHVTAASSDISSVPASNLASSLLCVFSNVKMATDSQKGGPD